MAKLVGDPRDKCDDAPMAMGDDDSARIARMRATLDSVLLRIRSTADQFGGDFAEKATARSEWQACAEPLRHELQEAYRTGMIHWQSILDHGRGLSELIRAGLTHSAVSLARSLAEGSVRSWYLLEMGVDPTERVRRMINDRLYAGVEDERLVRGMLPSDDQDAEIRHVAEAAEAVMRASLERTAVERARLLEMAKSLGLPVDAGSRRGHPHAGAARPSTQTLIGLVLGSAMHGVSFHRFSSAVAHAATHGGARMLMFYKDDAGRDLARIRDMGADDLSAQAWPAVGVFASAALLMFDQAGWPFDAIGPAVNELATAWNPPPSADILVQFDAMVGR